MYFCVGNSNKYIMYSIDFCSSAVSCVEVTLLWYTLQMPSAGSLRWREDVVWHDIQVSHCLVLTPFCDSENYILGHDLFPLDSTMLDIPTHTSVVKPMYRAAPPPPHLHLEAGNCSVHQT